MLDLSIQLNLHGITAFNRYTADRIKVNIRKCGNIYQRSSALLSP